MQILNTIIRGEGDGVKNISLHELYASFESALEFELFYTENLLFNLVLLLTLREKEEKGWLYSLG